MMRFLAPVLLASSILQSTLAQQNFGPDTYATWSLGSGEFTGLAFTIELPVNLPWTSIYAATQFQPILLNGGDSAFEYFDYIQYTNATGALVVPPIYTLSFHPITTVLGTPVTASVDFYPGDSVSISLTLGSGSGVVWDQAWSVARGAAGIAAGAAAASGTYDYTFPTGATFDMVWLGINFFNNFWDFGNVTWTNIKLTASTSDSSWCTPTPVSLYSPPFNATYPKGLSQAKVSGSTSTCTLPEMIWPQPPAALAAEAAFIPIIENCLRLEAEGLKCPGY